MSIWVYQIFQKGGKGYIRYNFCIFIVTILLQQILNLWPSRLRDWTELNYTINNKFKSKNKKNKTHVPVWLDICFNPKHMLDNFNWPYLWHFYAPASDDAGII